MPLRTKAPAGYSPSELAANTHGDILAALSHKGVAVTASTGDEGFNGGVHQSWPSNLPGRARPRWRP